MIIFLKLYYRYGEYPELSEHLHKYIKPKDDLLIVGCGNSTLGNDLYDVSYKYVLNKHLTPTVFIFVFLFFSETSLASIYLKW